MLKTLRAKLTLWNLVVLSATLALFGVFLNIANQQRLGAQIRRQLRDQARPIEFGPPGPRPGQARGPGGPAQGDGQSPGPNDHAPNGERPPGGPGGNQFVGHGLGGPPQGENGQPPPGSPPPSAGDPFAFIHRPELFDTNFQLTAPQDAQPFDSALLPMAKEGQEVYGETNFGGERIWVYAAPMIRQGKIVGEVEVARELRDYEALWQGQTVTLLILLPIALFVAGAGALFLTNRALKPVDQVTRTAAQIGAEDLGRRLPVHGQDELAHLASTFNEMIARLEVSFQELKEAYEHQRRFTADASHELRTPLTRLKLATGGALSSDDPAVLQESLRTADQAADAMSRIVQQLLILSRADAGQLALQKTPLDLRVVVAEAADAAEHPPAGGGPRVLTELPGSPVRVLGEEDHLKRAVMNLVQNALRHSAEPVKVRVGTEGGAALVVVEDKGEGIAPEHLPHLGERFYRVDAARSRTEGGFGLGLSICKSIAEAHGGSLRIESTLGIGTRATIRLPAG